MSHLIGYVELTGWDISSTFWVAKLQGLSALLSSVQILYCGFCLLIMDGFSSHAAYHSPCPSVTSHFGADQSGITSSGDSPLQHSEGVSVDFILASFLRFHNFFLNNQRHLFTAFW